VNPPDPKSVPFNHRTMGLADTDVTHDGTCYTAAQREHLCAQSPIIKELASKSPLTGQGFSGMMNTAMSLSESRHYPHKKGNFTC
jgi:hypothetical protein